MKIRIPRPVIEQARDFASQVYARRNKNTDKYTQGDELTADIKGFEVEFAHAHAFKQPSPQLTKGRKTDKGFDTVMILKTKKSVFPYPQFKVDIKASPKLLINEAQYNRSKADVYLFEQLDFLNWENDIIFLKIFGWTYHHDVPFISTLQTFSNGSHAYQVDKKKLKNPRYLYGLFTPLEFEAEKDVEAERMFLNTY